MSIVIFSPFITVTSLFECFACENYYMTNTNIEVKSNAVMLTVKTQNRSFVRIRSLINKNNELLRRVDQLYLLPVATDAVNLVQLIAH